MACQPADICPGSKEPVFRIAKINHILVKRLVMNNPTRYSLSIILGLLLSIQVAGARPLDFKEVSLLVRSHESEASIKDEVSRRRLMRSLSPQQETTLKAQGASDSLVQSLRNSNLVVSKEEAASFEAAAARSNEMPVYQQSGPRVHIFNAAFGQPVNLGQWGGADYEIVFNSYRCAGEDYIQPVIIDTVRTGTEVIRIINPFTNEADAFTSDWYPRNEVRSWRYTPYDARGDNRDNRFNFSDSVVGTSYSVGRPLRIDWDSPVFMEGQPYTFYPVYGAGGVSLYYICKSTDTTAKLAVVTR
jgi:hypothetical protein